MTTKFTQTSTGKPRKVLQPGVVEKIDYDYWFDEEIVKPWSIDLKKFTTLTHEIQELTLAETEAKSSDASLVSP
jgi:hypothetical protein